MAYRIRRLSWQQFAVGGLEVQRTPGDHVAMLQEPVIAREVAGMAARCLQRARAALAPQGPYQDDESQDREQYTELVGAPIVAREY